MRTSFLDGEGKLVTAQEFLENIFKELPALFTSEEELRKVWSKPNTRKELLKKLEEVGFNKTALVKLRELIDAEKSDLFDVLRYIFNSDVKPITRSERADTAKTSIHNTWSGEQQEFINFVLDQYIEFGVEELALIKLPALLKSKYQTVPDSERVLGDLENTRLLFINFQEHLYLQAAV